MAGAIEATGANVASLVLRHVSERPHEIALIDARRGEEATWEELITRSGRLCAALRGRGLGRGSRALLLLRPGVDSVACLLALLAIGAVPVLVDPGLGLRRMLECIRDARPVAVLGERVVHLVALIWPSAFASVTLRVTPGLWPGAVSLPRLLAEAPEADFAPALTSLDDPAIIAFTSGSTGTPKGVVMTNGVLRAQLTAIRDLAQLGPESVLVAFLPILAFLGPALGCRTLLPDMDTSRPHRLSPQRVAESMRRHGATHAFGSLCIWTRLGRWCADRHLRFPELRHMLMGGAPIPPTLLALWRGLVPEDATLQAPYGATEVLPIATVTATEVLEAPPGRGFLLGRPVEGLDLRLVCIDDGPMDAALDLPAGEAGEIVVRSARVAPAYASRPEADVLCRISDSGGSWYRTGDLARIDEGGRLWYLGRKAERVDTAHGRLFTALVEPAFAACAEVSEVALVGVGPPGEARPVLIVVPRRWPFGARARRRLAARVLASAGALADELGLRDVLFRRSLPVDVRHRAKILRLELAVWASQRLD